MPIVYSRFLVTNFVYACADPDIRFACSTDVPCSLSLFAGSNPPHYEPWRHKKRGVVETHERLLLWRFDLGIFYQDEPGDTLTHTFTIQPKTAGQRVWWYLDGHSVGVYMKSRSQFFNYQCPEQPQPPACHAMPGGSPWHGANNQSCITRPFRPYKTYLAERILLTILQDDWSWMPSPHIELAIWQTLPNAKPDGNALRLGEIPINPLYNGQLHTYTVVFMPIQLIELGQYAMSVAFHPSSDETGLWYGPRLPQNSPDTCLWNLTSWQYRMTVPPGDWWSPATHYNFNYSIPEAPP